MAALGPAGAFVAERAWELLLAQTALGPRYPGSPGHAAMRDWLRGALAPHVDEVLLQEFSYADAQAGDLALTNVIGVQGAERPRKLLLAAHWDTRPRADNDPQPARRDTPILGANDGASGVAVLLEIARVLQAQPPRVGVIYAFFDGEDWGFPALPSAWPPGSMLLGSCYYAAHVIPERPGWGILLDMVGGRRLALLQEGISLASAPHLVNRVWSAGRWLGHRLFRPEPGQQVLDDHVPLIRAGIPMVDLVDQAYPAWHTTADTPEQCDPRSLEAVGQTVLRVVYEEPVDRARGPARPARRPASRAAGGRGHAAAGGRRLAAEGVSPMTRLLVTGGGGFVGGRVLQRAGPTWEATGTYHASAPPVRPWAWQRLELRDAAVVDACLAAARPDVVIHAAYDKGAPEVVIAGGTAHFVAAATRVGARVLLISTDLVFDGREGHYREEDPPAPLAAYGAAKVVAEQTVLAAGGLVVRTSLVYSLRPADPANQALLVAPLARGETPCLFTDEYRTPIHVDDLADALLEVAAWPPPAWAALPAGGILHVGGPERLDRYTFARRLAPHLGVDVARLRAGTLAASGLVRAADSSLDTSRARALLRTPLRPLDVVLGAG